MIIWPVELLNRKTRYGYEQFGGAVTKGSEYPGPPRSRYSVRNWSESPNRMAACPRGGQETNKNS